MQIIPTIPIISRSDFETVRILPNKIEFTLAVALPLLINIMGILVISSILVVPVATAMQFKTNFKKTLILSVLIGFIDIICGLILSYIFNTAPGGTIALVSVMVLIISLIINKKNI